MGGRQRIPPKERAYGGAEGHNGARGRHCVHTAQVLKGSCVGKDCGEEQSERFQTHPHSFMLLQVWQTVQCAERKSSGHASAEGQSLRYSPVGCVCLLSP